jgi:hypothetical protein
LLINSISWDFIVVAFKFAAYDDAFPAIPLFADCDGEDEDDDDVVIPSLLLPK